MEPEPATTSTGRDDAFRAYVVPELDVMLRVARRLTGDPDVAEDLVQDALVRAYRAVDRFDGRHPRAWLLTILRNTWKNQLRRQRPVVSDFSETILDHAPARGADGRTGPEEHVLNGMLDPALAAALRSLTDKHRAVVVLVDIEGLTYRQAADALGIPAGTVMSRLHRARNKMRDQLQAAGDGRGGTP